MSTVVLGEPPAYANMDTRAFEVAWPLYESERGPTPGQPYPWSNLLAKQRELNELGSNRLSLIQRKLILERVPYCCDRACEDLKFPVVTYYGQFCPTQKGNSYPKIPVHIEEQLIGRTLNGHPLLILDSGEPHVVVYVDSVGIDNDNDETIEPRELGVVALVPARYFDFAK